MKGELFTDFWYYEIYYQESIRYKVRDVKISCNSTIQKIPLTIEWENFYFKCDRIIKEYLTQDKKNIFCLMLNDSEFWIDNSIFIVSFSELDNIFEYEICLSSPILSHNVHLLTSIKENMKQKTIFRRFKNK